MKYPSTNINRIYNQINNTFKNIEDSQTIITTSDSEYRIFFTFHPFKIRLLFTI